MTSLLRENPPNLPVFEPETRTSPRGRPYRKAVGRATVRVDGPGYDLERCTIGARNPGTFADQLHARHRDINATFDRASAIVEASTHPANLPGYLRKMEAVRVLWHAKGTKWRDAHKAADYATRGNAMYLTEDATARLRLLLLKPGYGGDKWLLLPGTPKSRKAGVGLG